MKKIKMPKIFTEFKEFITRGNVMGLAVGMIIGAAFTAIVNALVNSILKPLINASSPCSCPRMRTVWNSSAISIPR